MKGKEFLGFRYCRCIGATGEKLQKCVMCICSCKDETSAIYLLKGLSFHIIYRTQILLIFPIYFSML